MRSGSLVGDDFFAVEELFELWRPGGMKDG